MRRGGESGEAKEGEGKEGDRRRGREAVQTSKSKSAFDCISLSPVL